MASKGYAAMSPAFPKGKPKHTKSKKTVGKQTEGYTPPGAMRGGGSTTKQKQARSKRLADLKI